MKMVLVVVILVIVLAVPTFAYPTYTGGDNNGQLFNGVYGDWAPLVNSYVTIDMGSVATITSIGLHERWTGGLVYAFYIQFSNDLLYFTSPVQYKMDNSSVEFGDILWAKASFDPVQYRYCYFFADSTGTYIYADEMMINGLDGGGNPIPEPSSLLVLFGGVAGFVASRRKRKLKDTKRKRGGKR